MLTQYRCTVLFRLQRFFFGTHLHHLWFDIMPPAFGVAFLWTDLNKYLLNSVTIIQLWGVTSKTTSKFIFFPFKWKMKINLCKKCSSLLFVRQKVFEEWIINSDLWPPLFNAHSWKMIKSEMGGRLQMVFLVTKKEIVPDLKIDLALKIDVLALPLLRHSNKIYGK